MRPDASPCWSASPAKAGRAGSAAFLPAFRAAGRRNAILLVLATLLLAGCASGTQPDAMAVPPAPELAVPESSPFRNGVYLDSVSGDRESNPLWKSKVGNQEFESVLRTSLAGQQLLGIVRAESPYLLAVELVRLEQAEAGLNPKVNSVINYLLTENGKTVLKKTIASEFTATVREAFGEAKRLRLANEGTIRENIRTFLMELAALARR